MPHEATLTYTEPLIREAVLGFWRRSVGMGMVIALALCSGVLIYLLARGDRSWLVGALAVVVLMGIAFIATIYYVHHANAMRKLRAMGAPQARLIAEDTSFTVTSGGGNATMPWSSVAEVWQFKNCWLLLFSKAHFMTLPLANLSTDMRAFILERIASAGGKITA